MSRRLRWLVATILVGLMITLLSIPQQGQAIALDEGQPYVKAVYADQSLLGRALVGARATAWVESDGTTWMDIQASPRKEVHPESAPGPTRKLPPYVVTTVRGKTTKVPITAYRFNET